MRLETLMFGDCEYILGTIPEKTVDIFVTSPPYNLNIKYNRFKDDSEYKVYLDKMGRVFSQISKVLKEDGSFFLNVGSSNKNPWIYMDVANESRKFFILQNDIDWVKSISVGDNSYGHFKPINSKRYLNGLYEKLFHFTLSGEVPLNRKDIGVPYVYKSNITRHNKIEGDSKEDKRCRGNLWFIPYDTIQSKLERDNHPAVFPKKLVENCIRLHGFNEKTIVCDPFVGSRTTVLQCNEMGIKSIGIDIDEEYINNIKKRLEK